MSKISELIFHNAKHTLSSPFGKRAVIATSAGNTSSFHNGCDYSTDGKKLPQYGVADDGVVLSCGADSPAYGGALYVWVSYPSLGVKMLHYHLDSISVKKGQKVTKKTVIGYTGKTGKATGIHLHLGIKRLSGGDYIDPEKWSKDEYPKLISTQATTTSKTTTTTTAKTQTTTKPKYTVGNYKVTKADLLNVRKGAGTKYAALTFSQLSKSAQSKILALTKNVKKNGYVKNLTFTVSEVKDNWGKTPSGWVCLDYCTKI